MKKIVVTLFMMFAFTLFTVNATASEKALPLITELDESIDYAEFSSDNKMLLTVSSRREVAIWNVATGTKITVIGHGITGSPKAVFSKDGKKIFVVGSISGDFRIEEYDAKTGKFLGIILEFTGYSFGYDAGLNSVFNEDQTIAYLINFGDILVMDVNSNKVIYFEEGDFRELAYNAVTDELAVATLSDIYILDGTTGEAKAKVASPFSTEQPSIDALAYTNRGGYLFVSYWKKNLQRFDVIDYTAVSQSDKQFSTSNYNSKAINFSPDDKYVILSNPYWPIYHAETGEFLGEFDGTYSDYATFSHDSKKVILGNDIFDATAIEGSELANIYITGETSIVPIGSSTTYRAIGLTKDGTSLEIDANEIIWSVEDERILSFFYGGFTGKNSGITSVTAKYKNLSETILVIVTKPFSDVLTTDPNYTVIHFMREYGIINGYDNGTYRPNNAIQRHHVAAMIGRSNVKLKNIRSAKAFKDIPTSHPNYENIQNLYRAGVIDGIDNKFNPEQNITHIQLAKILTNIFGFQKADAKKYSFTDIKKDSWGQSYAEIMVSNEIMPFPKGSFNANTPVTRSQFASYFYNALVKSGNL